MAITCSENYSSRVEIYWKCLFPDANVVLKKTSDEIPHTEVHMLHSEVYFSTYVSDRWNRVGCRLLVTTETLHHWLYSVSSSERQVFVFDYVDKWKFLSKGLFSNDLLKIALQWTSREQLLTSSKVLVFYVIFHETDSCRITELWNWKETIANKLELKFWLMNCDITFPNHA